MSAQSLGLDVTVDCLSKNLDSGASWLCDLEQVTKPFSCVK